MLFTVDKTLLTLPKRQILDSSKPKAFVDDNSKFDENSGKFYKQVENTGKKEKLLITSNFSFSHSVFYRPLPQTHKNKGLFGKGLNNANF